MKVEKDNLRKWNTSRTEEGDWAFAVRADIIKLVGGFLFLINLVFAVIVFWTNPVILMIPSTIWFVSIVVMFSVLMSWSPAICAFCGNESVDESLVIESVRVIE